MKAALSARQDPRLVIAGRTSALAVTGIDDTLKRAKAYEAAGGGAIFLAGGVTVAGIGAVSSAGTIPLVPGGRARPPRHPRGGGGACAARGGGGWEGVALGRGPVGGAQAEVGPAVYVPSPLAWLFTAWAPGPVPGRLTLSNFTFDNARVQAVITPYPDCQERAGTAISDFEIPLNGTRIVAALPGSDVCWRRALPPGQPRNAATGPPR